MADSTPEEESAGQDVPETDAADDTTEVQLDELLTESLDKAFTEEPEEPQDAGSTSEDEEAPEEENAEAPPPEEVEASEGDTDQEEVVAETPEVPPLDAPEHWSAADKERFSGMPRDAQEYVLERDKSMTADYTRKTQETAQMRQQLEPLMHVLEPMMPAIRQAGLTPQQYMAQLIQGDRSIQQNPLGAIRHIASNAGISLEALEQPAATVPQPDPLLTTLQQEVRNLQGHIQTSEQRAEQERLAGLQYSIDGFANEKDEAGNLKHPHFEALRANMGQLMTAGAANDLNEAYQKALRLDDTLYQESIEAEKSKVKEAEDKRRKEAVAKAKKVPTRRSANPPSGSVQANDLDGVLAGVLDGAGM